VPFLTAGPVRDAARGKKAAETSVQKGPPPKEWPESREETPKKGYSAVMLALSPCCAAPTNVALRGSV